MLWIFQLWPVSSVFLLPNFITKGRKEISLFLLFLGFSGKNCSMDIDDCASAPCQNGATCRDFINSYSCQCAEGNIWLVFVNWSLSYATDLCHLWCFCSVHLHYPLPIVLKKKMGPAIFDPIQAIWTYSCFYGSDHSHLMLNCWVSVCSSIVMCKISFQAAYENWSRYNNETFDMYINHVLKWHHLLFWDFCIA